MSRVRVDASSRMPLAASASVDAPLLDVMQELENALESREPKYVELMARTNFSFLRGGSSPERLIQTAKRQGLKCIAVTDVNGIYGVVRAWEEARKHGIKLLVGAEVTLAFGAHIRPAILLVQNLEGYTHLCEVLTEVHAERVTADARPALTVDARFLCLRAAGLIVLVPALVPPGWSPVQSTAAVSSATWLQTECQLVSSLQAAFGRRVLLAVTLHKDGRDRERLTTALSIERQTQIPIVASNQVRYATPKDKLLYDVLTCIAEKCSLDEAGTRLAPNTEAYLKGEREMLTLFGNYPAWTARSLEVAEACTFSLSELKYKFPCELPAGVTADEELRRLTELGAEARYRGNVPGSVRAQIEKELRLIAKIEVAAYFLSIRHIVDMARARDILCQGRGSAANSAVCYCLGITAVDPARSNLLFERFLSEERKEPPDIDIDFEHERREEVIQDIYQKYGRDRAAMVSEVVCYRARSALREVGKVLGFSLEQVDRLAKITSYWDEVGSVPPKRLKEAGFDVADARVALALQLASALQGYPRHLSIHVGGFVLSAEPLSQIAPVQPATMPGRTVIPWDKDDLDVLGFFKVDVLGLGMLTAIRKALDLIGDPLRSGHQAGANKLSAIDRLARIPSEDDKVYDALCDADTVGVFQIESRAQMAMLPRLAPRRFYDLVVEVAIVRPGPIQGGMVHPYLRRKNGEEPVDCPHPVLAPILDRTLGVPLFQEQVMQIAIVGAGYTGGEADQLRRDMAAWKRNGKLEGHREKLHQGFVRRGISSDFAERLFAQIRGFGEYGFPGSRCITRLFLLWLW
jgi:error-prone DNA polymerase